MDASDFDYSKVPEPVVWPDANKRLIKSAGVTVDPSLRLSTFSANEFENFVNQWVHEYLKSQYDSVELRRGAGDKGRDIVGWVDPSGTVPRQWDNYQCKHYASALAPTNIYVELGKLCYFTFRNDYTIPRKYFFVCNSGVGTSLADDIEAPVTLRSNLIAAWPTYCETKISKKEKVLLEGAFRSYVEKFDFSIIGWVTPADLLEQHAKTRYHDLIFGTQLKKRGPIQAPPKKIVAKENRYVEQLFESYSDHQNELLTSTQDLKKKTEFSELVQHFEDSRRAFFSAESLSEFARDNLPKQEDYFADLTDRFLTGIKPTVRKTHSSGYERLLSAVETAHSLQLGDHVLDGDVHPLDREGICHQLANANKVTWTTKKSK